MNIIKCVLFFPAELRTIRIIIIIIIVFVVVILILILLLVILYYLLNQNVSTLVSASN